MSRRSVKHMTPREFVQYTKERARSSFQRGKQNIFARIAKLIFHRAFFVSLAILVQLAVLAVVCIWFLRYFALFYLFYIIVSVAAVLAIISARYQAAYKIAWAVLVLAVPVFGGVMYLLYGGNKLNKRERKKMALQEQLFYGYMGQTEDAAMERLNELGGNAVTQARYLASSGCPPHLNTETEYFPIGEAMFQRMKEELEKAEHFIFLEYFIIRPGKMWGEILEILLRKVAQGVDVRVLYDDIGCLYTLPKHYDRTLREMGIACEVFNRYRPVVSLRLNNRDHRKIMVIDGNVGFTGGINLSDEYINEWERFGHWKDTGILLRGEGVWSFTVMFLSAWDIITGAKDDFDRFRPSLKERPPRSEGVVVQPYNDTPLDEVAVGASVYHNLISKASEYLYITTPYLVVDDDMTTALCAAARSGVDVRLITPHIPDKKIVFELTRAHYQILLEAGVRIFEYTPGFIHAKNFAVDDQFGTVGTVNLDYRSLYLHYECGVWVADRDTIVAIREDFLETQALSQEITLEDARRFSRTKRFRHALLRAFAPLF